MNTLEERVDVLEEFLLATSSLDRFRNTAKKIAEKLDVWNHPDAANDFDGMYMDLNQEPYCNDSADFDAYLLRVYDVNGLEELPSLTARRTLRKGRLEQDTLWNIAVNRLSIYGQMSRKRGVISWLDEVNRRTALSVTSEVDELNKIMNQFSGAYDNLIRQYPDQKLIDSCSR